MNKSRASQERINAILHADEKIYESDSPAKLNELTKGIRYKDVFFKYRDENVLKDVSFEIPVGKTVALVGESGSGKSTLADLLPRFYDVQEGAVYFDDINIKEVSMYDYSYSV